MNCEFERRDGILHVRGEMNIYSAGALKEALLDTLPGEAEACLVDCSGISEIDTSGLQVLLMAKRVCAANNVRFGLLAPSPALAETLDLLHLAADLVVPAATIAAATATAQ
jgi:anti-anti-sigma factor